MRIAIWHNLPSGGGKRALYDQVHTLRNLGHYVEAWCPPSANREFLPLAELIKENVIRLDELAPGPTGAIRRRIHLVKEVVLSLQRMERHCEECAAAINIGGFDLLYVHACQFFHTSPIARFATIPTLLYLQEPFRGLYEAWPDFPWAAPQQPFRKFSVGYWNRCITETIALSGRRIQVREEAKWAKAFDQVLVNSLFSRETLVRVYNIDSRVCYLGVDTSHFKPTSAPKERFVIGLGSLFFNKRPLFAVQSVAAIPLEKRPKLIWVGNTGTVEKVKREAEKLEVDFEFRMLIADEELRDLLGRAAVMIYASHLEPFGYAPLEANACGTAVVALAEGGIRETMTDPDCGVLIPNLDPEAFARALLVYCDNLNLAAESGQRARAFVERCWSKEKAGVSLMHEIERVGAKCAAKIKVS
jgi:glycosyltransferase involved in cell wall biosynthesis